VDFSESGMAFECTSDFPVGEQLQINFVNPKNRSRILLKSEIVRKTSMPTGSSVFYGVVFRQMSDKDSQDIPQFISRSSLSFHFSPGATPCSGLESHCNNPKEDK